MRLEEGVYVTELTPPGRGAIATLRVEGPRAVSLIRPMVYTSEGRPRDSFPVDRPILVRFGPEPAEEVVLRCFADGAVEIHCHGGRAAISRIQTLLTEAGCQPLHWSEWVFRRVQEPVAAEAFVGLACAPTERTAAILLDQLHGALRREIRKVLEVLESAPATAAESLWALLARSRLGEHLTRPWEVVFVGRPNVGKSSLINALLGYTRAIVHPQPGTTRDVLSASTALEGWPVCLVDTAGWRESADPIEQAGIALAQEYVQRADLVVVVTDLSQPWTEACAALCSAFPSGMVIHNKCDLVLRSGPQNTPEPEASPCHGSLFPAEAIPGQSLLSSLREDFGGSVRPPGLWVSALTGQGLPELVRQIVARLVPEPPPRGTGVPFTPRQVQALRSAQELLGRNDLPGVIQALQRVLTPEVGHPEEMSCNQR